jgi:hypothetical protein
LLFPGVCATLLERLAFAAKGDPMKPVFSETLLSDIFQSTRNALAKAGIVNVPLLADDIRRRNEAENVALEDVEYAVLQQAQRLHAAIEFDACPVSIRVPKDIGGGAPAVELVACSPARD